MFGTLSYLRFAVLRIVREKGMEKNIPFFLHSPVLNSYGINRVENDYEISDKEMTRKCYT